MAEDCLDYARRCKACQFHVNFIHQPPEVLHPTVASWPFDAWGLDVVSPLPKYSGRHLFILAATDYFSKWAETVSLKEVKKENVANFIRVNIIYRFSIPRYILTDVVPPFSSRSPGFGIHGGITRFLLGIGYFEESPPNGLW
ncbi:uncharacterized protein [Nicotiana sylvestris]|uniref:uncharacterized protein n=1 Tax=Nicotiana sylvestris TaxID=4096 RepID=UPI00388C5B9D